MHYFKQLLVPVTRLAAEVRPRLAWGLWKKQIQASITTHKTIEINN